jgi:hypothetical protein
VTPGTTSGGPAGLRSGDSTTLHWGLGFDNLGEVVAKVFQGFDQAKVYLGGWLNLLRTITSFFLCTATVKRVWALGLWGLSVDLAGVGGIPLPGAGEEPYWEGSSGGHVGRGPSRFGGA